MLWNIVSNILTNFSTWQTPRLYCAANYEDLSEVVKHVRDNNPDVLIGATGISMGGLILGNYLAGKGKDSGVTASMIISVPWNVFKGKIIVCFLKKLVYVKKNLYFNITFVINT